MAVVIEHFFERPFVDDRLFALEAFALLALERLDGDGAELDAFDRLPRLLVALEETDAVETRVFKRLEESVFGERAADAAAPQRRIVLQSERHFFIAHDVADHSASAIA